MRTFGLLAVGALLATACGGGSGSPAGQEQGRRIDIEMRRNFAFSTQALTLKTGERVVLAFKNTDAVEHEFMAGRQATPSVGYKEDLLATAKPQIASPAEHGKAHGGHEANVGLRLMPGQSGTVTLVVPEMLAGDWEFGCFVAGHHESGMKGKLTIAK